MSTATEAVPDQGIDPSRLTRRLRILLTIIIVADVLDLMDSTITNIAAPTIVREIGGGESLIKWLGASYAMAMGVLLVVGGRLGDRYGKRRIFLIGIVGFVAASLLCGISVSPSMLIGSRIVQGSFGALMIPQGISILTASFSRAQIPRAVSAFGPAMAVSAVLGPIVAGFIIDADIAGLTWRPIFLINVILGGVGFAAALKYLPHDLPSEGVVIDGLGAGLLGASVLGLMYGLIQGSTTGWALTPILSLVIGTALFGAFCLRQCTETNPLIIPSLLKNRGIHVRASARLRLFRRGERIRLRHLALLPDRPRAQSLTCCHRSRSGDDRHHWCEPGGQTTDQQAGSAAGRHRVGHHLGRCRRPLVDRVPRGQVCRRLGDGTIAAGPGHRHGRLFQQHL